MENLKARISEALEAELTAIYDDLRVNTGDITPMQHLRWERLTQDMADLFSELIENNR